MAGKSLLLALLCGFLLPSPETDTLTTFRDDHLHYSFSYPVGLKNRAVTSARPAGDVPSKATDLSARITDCTAIPVAAVRPEAGRLFDMVMILDLDLKCAHETLSMSGLASFAKGMSGKILSQHGVAEVGLLQPFKLAGHDAVYLNEKVDETSKSTGQVLHGAATCALIDSHAVCWQVLSYNADTLNQLLALQVAFDGSPAAPLSPPK